VHERQRALPRLAELVVESGVVETSCGGVESGRGVVDAVGSEGPVGLSTRHALAIVNRGGATAAQIVDFAARVRDAVMTQFGLVLAVEPVLLGFTPAEASGLAAAVDAPPGPLLE